MLNAMESKLTLSTLSDLLLEMTLPAPTLQYTCTAPTRKQHPKGTPTFPSTAPLAA